ncbi:MAG TPA: hypothetical protein VM260_20075 [Pirellula sp.]|nr:hypothetical protein [Pirellula sp.]
MATEEQSKKRIVKALRALRVILTQGPRREFTDGLKEHPEVRKLNADIERALSPYPRILDYEGLFRYFVPCDVLTLKELPADWETIKWLDHYIERCGDATVNCQSIGSKRSPNQNSPEKRKQKIRTAIKQKATCRGMQKTALSKQLSRWKKEWSEEYSEVMRENQG